MGKCVMFKLPQIIIDSELKLADVHRKIDETALYNQRKVLTAFQNNKIAARHFAGTNGYGYDDIGRDMLGKVFAEVFASESAVVSPFIASGTHAIAAMLFAVLRPGDKLLCITGKPYDTLNKVIIGKTVGSLFDFNISTNFIALRHDGHLDIEAIKKEVCADKAIKAVFLGRSRGYEWRDAISIADIKNITKIIKDINKNIYVLVDNCYGEFVDKEEPGAVGVDLVAGSLIKNPGGGIVQTGGYVVGRKELIELVTARLIAPGIGGEIGSYAYGYGSYYQGLFFAPHVTAGTLKACTLFAQVFKSLGYEVLPKNFNSLGDIICSIKFNDEEKLLDFIRSIQKASPVDSNVVPYPWAMPGYEDEVVMAAGTFVQGSSIELSADAPIREPYIAYVQGSLTYEHAKLALMECLGFLK